MEKAQETLDDLTNTVTELVKNSLEALQSNENTIKKLGDDAIEEIKKKIEDLFANTKQILEQIIEEAAKNGIDIKKLTKYLDQFQELTIRTSENTIESIMVEVETGVKIITDALNTIKKISDSICKLSEKLKNCPTDSYFNIIAHVAICISDSATMNVSIPLEIAEQGTTAATFVVDFPFRIGNIGADLVSKAQEETKKIVEDLKKEIHNLL